MFYSQFEKLCKIHNTAPTTVLRKLGFSSSKITAWKNGSSPNFDVACKIAQHFDVSLDYFAVESDKEDRCMFTSCSENRITGGNELTQTESELLEEFSQLDERDQLIALGEIKMYVRMALSKKVKSSNYHSKNNRNTIDNQDAATREVS